MNLGDWLKRNNRTQIGFAEEIGVSAGLITGYCNGTIWPSRDRAERIFVATSGEVSPNDFLRLDNGAAPASNEAGE